MDLAGVERDERPAGEADQQRPGVVDPRADALAVRPADRLVAERIAGTERGEGVLRRLVEAPLEQAQQLLQRRLEVAGRAPEAGRAVAQVGREVGEVDRDVDADPQHRPAVLPARLDEDPGQLPAVEQDVVRPLDAGVVAGQVGDREAGAERQERVVVAQQEREQEGAAAGPGPRAALPAASRRLHACGDQRAVRRAGRGERPRAVVGRRGLAQVQPRPPERARHAAGPARWPAASPARASTAAASVTSSPGRTRSACAASPRLTAIAAVRAASS